MPNSNVKTILVPMEGEQFGQVWIGLMSQVRSVDPTRSVSTSHLI
jgi:hypothetical protein